VDSRDVCERGVARIWLARPGDIVEPGLLSRYEAMLDDNESERYHRFVRADDAHLFLVSHALLRVSLSSCCSTPPKDWQFVRSSNGRPEIRTPLQTILLRFSLSHTKGLAGCLVVEDDDVGLDVERIDRVNDCSRLAKHYFSDSENRALNCLPENQRRVLFFQLWTLKEAYLKARGTGLTTPLKDCEFHIDRHFHNSHFLVEQG